MSQMMARIIARQSRFFRLSRLLESIISFFRNLIKGVNDARLYGVTLRLHISPAFFYILLSGIIVFGSAGLTLWADAHILEYFRELSGK